MSSKGITRFSKKVIQIQNHLKNTPMLHNAFLEAECYQIEGGVRIVYCQAQMARESLNLTNHILAAQ